jgi:hypothetical protein
MTKARKQETQQVTSRPSAEEIRSLLHEAVLLTLERRGLVGEIVDLPGGEEIEVSASPLLPVPGARFFLRVETSVPRSGPGNSRWVPVATPLLVSWRTTPEPVAVVALDPETGSGWIGEAHAFLAELDLRHRGWERSPAVLFPLQENLDGPALDRLARRAADEHVLFQRVLGSLRALDREPSPAHMQEALARLRETDFSFTVACLDLLREAGMLEEEGDRGLRATDEVTQSFAAAAVQHGLGARGPVDRTSAADAGRSAVVRIVLARFPDCSESTSTRCAVLLSRFLPVDDTDAILAVAGDEEALGRALAGDAPST